MANRVRTSYQKRQRELAKKEKRQMKEERRAQRKLAQEGKATSEKPASPSELEPENGPQAT